jgi:virulence-associated protein VagC
MARKAKLFMNGRSQAVRLPAEFRFRGDVAVTDNVRNFERIGGLTLENWLRPT